MLLNNIKIKLFDPLNAQIKYEYTVYKYKFINKYYIYFEALSSPLFINHFNNIT